MDGATPLGPDEDEEVVELALEPTSCAGQGLLSRREHVTSIDLFTPVDEARLWMLERSTYRELVSHGRGTGGHLAKQFSNRPGESSEQSRAFRHGRGLPR
ncbi:MAG TPA: murein L,D-transpeptidase catalytic domain family protein [Vicinamibacteria bacterium]|nr:murein L,D-transpeptidase catalytic domain family protein [Vicinamibacteria bacterium]